VKWKDINVTCTTKARIRSVEPLPWAAPASAAVTGRQAAAQVRPRAGAVLTEVSHFAYQAAEALGLHGIEFGLFAQGLYIAANAVTFVIR
jgi:hypothetical protein